MRQAEVGFGFSRGQNIAAFRYISDQRDLAPEPLNANYEYFQANGQVFLVGDWGVSFNAIRDLNADLWQRSEIGLVYLDECLRFEVVYERNETLLGNAGVRASEGVFFRLNLATLGSSGYDASEGVR